MPLYKNYVVKGNNVIISFTHIGLGLATSDTDPLKGFSIAGKDKKFYWAPARIEGNKVIVSSDKIDALVAVRYAWSDKPVCNLVNSEGLPAIPFRTDDWKGITQK